MADLTKACVRARGTALVPNPDSDPNNVMRRHVGRLLAEVEPGHFGFAPSGSDETVTATTEIARAIADGDLWPANLETAAWAAAITKVAVTFDPSFGGEVKTTKASTKAGKESA